LVLHGLKVGRGGPRVKMLADGVGREPALFTIEASPFTFSFDQRLYLVRGINWRHVSSAVATRPSSFMILMDQARPPGPQPGSS
jgi:hypothetical protein